ncbi:alpha- and gamma-adaptin-binding protein p34-like [Amphiura filiformis]|uniref:alpha- and gamma-adaptin-binding protein p34-like n=1 Tax=Amphiura filiformis TaxID=82378 RepID=UPI003B210C1E
MAAPCALVVSCCSAVKSEDLMKEMIGKDELPPGELITDGIVGYPWLVDNKYYTANIQLCTTPEKTIGNQQFAESLEAVIIACSDEKSSFESVKQWLPFINELSPEIQILACEQFSKSKEITRDEVAVWCLDNSFELVELQLSEEDEEDQDEFDVIGTKRIVSALHAHMWPNLEMKEEIFPHRIPESIPNGEETSDTNTTENTNQTETVSDQIRTNLDTQVTASASQGSNNESNDEKVESSSSTSDGDASVAKETGSSGAEGAAGVGEAGDKSEKKTAENRIDTLIDEDMRLFEALGNEDPGGESFEQLFSRMATMKAHAATLAEEDRKKYAEKVAIAFWRAMGGDEAEIDGLDDDSD